MNPEKEILFDSLALSPNVKRDVFSVVRAMENKGEMLRSEILRKLDWNHNYKRLARVLLVLLEFKLVKMSEAGSLTWFELA